MGGSDENNLSVIGLANVQSGLRVGEKVVVGNGNGQNRRALSDINTNIIGLPPRLPALKKTTLSGKDVVSEKPPVVPVHRPMTRKFAAELANKQQLEPEGAKKQCASTYNLNESKDYNDWDVPMFVQHTEAMLDEIDRMEIEMEYMDEEPVLDIDVCDKKNALAIVEYIDELYTYYRKMEGSSCVPPNYMEHQFDINERMRAILIDWLIEVHYKFELMEETLYLTINLIDRFLAVQTVVRKKLQLVGVTALLLACKYEEVSVPVVEDLILISDRAYCRKELLDMERLMVNSLKFNMSVPTPYVFMIRFLKAAQSDKKFELLSFFIIELCLVEYQMLKFPPSLLAAAAVFTAQCTLSGMKVWSKTCESYTGYKEEELIECSRLMVTYHQKAGSSKLTGVYRKYSTSRFGYASKFKPAATSLLESRYHR